MVSAPSRSALLTTKTSATSRMPALAAWMPSPIPGATSTSVVSASEAISSSDWPDADGLDQHDVAAGGVEHPQRLRRRPGEPAEVAARGHRADVDAAVAGVVLHPHAVTEQRPAGERRRRVDGEHADPPAVGAQRAHQRRRRRRLPTPGEPVSPRTCACPVCGASAAATSRSIGLASSTREISRATERASPSRAPLDERGDVGRPPAAPPGGAGAAGSTAVPRSTSGGHVQDQRVALTTAAAQRGAARRRHRGDPARAPGPARSAPRSCRSGGPARWRHR